MLARIQQSIAVGLTGLLIAVAVIAVWREQAPLALAGPAALIVLYAAVLGFEFLALWRSYRPGDSDRPRRLQLAGAWLRETATGPRVFLWQQPFRSHSQPDHLPATPTGQRGVLFIHGFFCNRGVWNSWMRRLRSHDVPCIAIDLEPLFDSIDRYADQVEAAVERLERATQMAPVIVAHSMGGLAARAWLARISSDPKRVHRLVTIATPHGGTSLATRGSRANIRQMRIGSEWLLALAERESPALREQMVCFWSHCDNIVVPSRGATLDGADNRHLPATPHVRMVEHPAIFDAVLQLLASRRSASPQI